MPEFVQHFSEIVDLSPEEVKGESKLEDLDGWNSMAMISFIVFADEECGRSLSPRLAAPCQTVEDLAKLSGVQA